MALKFKKCNRNAKILESGEWRLASVKEVQSHLSKIVGSRDMVRLLDGCVDVPAYGYNCRQEYRPNMKHMLLVKTEKSGGSETYSEVLSPEGREAALLLSCEDKITRVILFVLESIVQNFKERGERQDKLDCLMEILKKKFREGKTAMHYAADQSHTKEHAKDIAKFIVKNFERGKELVKATDKYGTTALHFAAFNGNTELCSYLIEDCGMRANEKDQNGENLLHFAVRGKTSSEFRKLYDLSGGEHIIDSEDAQGKTVLHRAAAKKKGLTMIGVLLSKLSDEQRIQYIGQADLLGQTAFHEATRSGNLDVVERLLQVVEGRSDGKTALPCAVELSEKRAKHVAKFLLQRNADGKTVLHYAVELSNTCPENAKVMAEKLLKRCKPQNAKSLLLWASATGIGTAEEASPNSSPVKRYLEKEREELEKKSEVNLLESAIELEQGNMACELVNRGANLAKIADNPSPRVRKFRNQIAKMPERGRDQPTIDDGLGRKHFAEGLAALFLNPCVKTPVTVGILGDWGMGKSSLMSQTEITMLKTSAQLAFPNLLVTQDFPGCIKFTLSAEGKNKYDKIKNAVKALEIEDLPDHEEDRLVSFLDNYQEKYHEVYKSLALMDRKEMYPKEKSNSSIHRYSLANIPSVLPVRYNAWQYQNEREAWAGLAVAIPTAIEESMTRAQRLRCRWRYAWKEHRNEMFLELFLPCFLVVFLSGFVAFVLGRLFSRSEDKELVQLKYGSIPITIVVTLWTLIKQVNSVLKPISAQIMGYLRLPNHSINLGYQHQVISDIKFSKEEFGEKPSCRWKFIAFLWSFCGLRPDNVKGTSIPKSPPPREDDIRIIVFVDDLDRCQDTVILKVLSAVNLVLAACEINVILGMDKKMIKRAIRKKFKDNKNDKDLAEKYLSKIVQLPLALPDATANELENFVEQQLGPDFEGCSDPNAGEQDPNAGEQDPNADGSGFHSAPDIDGSTCHCVLDIDCCICHCALPVYPSKTKNSLTRITNRLFGRKPGLENKTSKRLSTTLKMMLLLPNYSPKEQAAIKWLSKEVANYERLPREWKRFLTYHRVAWNILSQSEQVRKCAGWQVQLLVWIFCCWQWKDQINEIIKNWKRLVLNGHSINNEEPKEEAETDTLTKSDMEQNEKGSGKPKNEEKDEGGEKAGKANAKKGKKMKKKADVTKAKGKEEATEVKAEPEVKEKASSSGDDKADQANDEEDEEQMPSPQSLRNIVQIYMEEKEKEAEMKGEFKTEEEQKPMVNEKRKGKREENRKTKGKGKEEKEKWDELKKTLIKYDVSVECVLAFQKFRLHCEMQNLPEPTTDENGEQSKIGTSISKATPQEPCCSGKKHS